MHELRGRFRLAPKPLSHLGVAAEVRMQHLDHDTARQELKAAQNQARYDQMGQKDLTREVKRLEKDMFDAAKNLEFERAAQLRDQLKKLKEQLFVKAA